MKAIKRKLLSLVLAMAMVLTLAPTALADATGTVTTTTATTNVATTLAVSLDATYAGYTINITGGTVTSKPDTVQTAPTIGAGGAVTFPAAGSYGVSVTGTATAPTTDPDITPDSVNFTATGTVIVTDPPQAKNKIVITGATGNGPYTYSMNGGTSSTSLSASVQTSTGAAASGTVAISGGSSSICTATINNGAITLNAANVSTTQNQQFTLSCDGADSQTLTVTVNPVTKQKPTLTLANAPTLAAYGTITVNMPTGMSYTGISWAYGTANILTVATTPTSNTSYVVTGIAAGTTTVSATLSGVTGGGYSNETVTTDAISVTVSGGGIVATLTPYNTITPNNGTTVYLDNWSDYNNANYRTFTLTPKLTNNGSDITNTATVSYQWTLNGYNVQSNNVTSPYSYTLYSNNTYLKYGVTNNTLKCTATFTYILGAETKTTIAEYICYINTGYSNVLASATVYSGTTGYALGDVDDAGKTSIVDQLDSYFYSTTNGRYGVAYVKFSSTTSGTVGSLNANTSYEYYTDRYLSGASYRSLGDVLFYPGTTTGTASFPVTVWYYTNYSQTGGYGNTASVSGTITFNVTTGVSTGDITYSASIGSDVPFTLKDFEDFYYTKTRGSLSYVTFTLPSGGSLYADGGRLSSSNACYASPTRNQTDLAGVYFSPTGTTATRANTVRISFTAYGNRTNASGTVAITYLAGSAKDITYNVNNSAALKVSDFTDAYRQVVGSTAPTGLTIEFQSAPANGTLSYKDSSRTNSSAVTLRSSNIKSYKFTTRTTGTNQLSDVTYTANGNRSDTIEYIAYVNSTPQFTGKVVFNGSNTSAATMQIGFTSTNGQAVAFSYAEFVKENAVIMASTSYIRFVTLPTGGTLSYNGAAMTLSSTNIPPASLGSVSYRPSAGFNNNTDRASFLCYDANGNSVGGGQVSIIVTGNTGGNSAGAVTVSQLKDVSATAWYRNDLITLVNAGIIQGRGDGKFDPTAELTYGEALKIFMMASGSPKLDEPSGKNWAVNYRSAAARSGWINESVDLNAKISRNAMAELAAKSLGVSPTDGVPPTWKDGTSNSYANALYYTNPQILIGNADGTFKGNDTLKRQEICAIAARVLTYRSGQQSIDKPGWLG